MSLLPLVVVLCGGLGTRLGALTERVPKPLVSVRGRPFLDHQVSLLESQGFDRFLFLTGHLGDQIEEHVKMRGDRVPPALFSREVEPLGTGGALLQAADLLPEVFLLLNGDSYLAMDYARLVEGFQLTDAVGALAAYRNPRSSAAVEGNNLALEGERVVLYQKRGRDPRLTHVDAGVGVYRRSLLGFARAGDPRPLSLEETVWPRVIAEGRLLAQEVAEPPFDIGTPERLAAFEARLS